ncbi:hypothetical protein [Streptomyces avicenniae]|uniref:hypothetical protein n=1 Tax=Streptomyces avicenniae TaxID=500153 RepID=UPI00069B5F87|nr:hypothetical protein [Streptomyces avicenniae]
MATPPVIRVRFEGGPRDGRTIDLVITDRAPLILAARTEDGARPAPGLYELRATRGGGTRYTWIDELPVRAPTVRAPQPPAHETVTTTGRGRAAAPPAAARP